MPQTASSESLISRILKSVFFKKATGNAGRYAQNAVSLGGLLKKVLSKVGSLRGETYQELRHNVLLLVRMLRLYASGDYRAIPWKTITRMVAVLLYFLSPIDVIPDLLPVVGLTDDIALILWLLNAIQDDLETFKEWDKKRNVVPIG